MNQLLKIGQELQVENNIPCRTNAFIGGGGQGEVYQAELNGKPVALKWYFPDQATSAQRCLLENLIQKGAPNDRFLWPTSLVRNTDGKGLGYLMPLREKRYKSIIDLMKGRIEPSFRALATAGLELAHSFLLLHSKGLCYRDISFGNVFFDPQTGNVLICDNDNVGTEGQSGIGVLGTPRFMAPEIVRGETVPGTQTDLYSLAVLLFYMLMVHHPLEGEKETRIKCFDLPAMNKLYGTEPLFIFDPHDQSNRPVKGIHNNALIYWQIYPQFIRDAFTTAFTDGICDPLKRVRESQWRSFMSQLRDSIIYCGNCGEQNFYDAEIFQQNGKLNPCWNCKKLLPIPPRIRIGKSVVMLNHDTQLFPHHTENRNEYDFSAPVAEVSRHPKDPNIWGLKNLSKDKWVAAFPDGSFKDIEPGRNITLAQGIRIQFGQSEGEIRL